MNIYTSQDFDALLNLEPDEASQDNELSNYPPLPAFNSAPYMSLNANLFPLPMPAVPGNASFNADAQLGQHGEVLSAVPEFSQEKMRALWRVVKAARRPGSLTVDPDVLLQRFLNSLGNSVPQQVAPAPNVISNSPKFVRNVAYPTQHQPKVKLPPAGAKINHARDKKTDNRIGDYEWYDDFPTRANWTARDDQYQFQIKYDRTGELDFSLRFNRKALEAYIRGCAGHGIPLRLWIQNSATMHTDRFPNRVSPFCRARNCPVRKNTISRGMYQVCLDEYPVETSNGRYNPFYVAGYMHLFCLEEMISLAELMMFADVQADVREFPLEQRNPMSLNRDGVGRTLLGAYKDWKSVHFDHFVQNGRPIPRSPRKSGDCLYKHLTLKKMDSQPTTRQKMRDQRNGIDISKHRGNLRKLMTYKADAKRKRKHRANSEDDLEDAESDIEVAVALSGSPRKRQRFELQPVPSTPLRRSHRLLNAAAAHEDEAPASLNAFFTNRTPASVPGPAAYNAYGFPNHNLPAFPAAAPVSHPRSASRSLNVVTDQVTMTASHNVLDNFDLTNVSIDVARNTFRGGYGQMMSQTRVTESQTSQSSLPDYVASPQSPYQLRDTQARRQSAERFLSARSPQMNTSNFAIDPQLLQDLYNDDLENPAAPHARPSSGQANVSMSGDRSATPPRRVTRSMSRVVSPPIGQAAEVSESVIRPAAEVLADLDDFNELLDVSLDNVDLEAFDWDQYLENIDSSDLHDA
ncbi:hypothetical protein SEPCBS57363_004525 [Sporothrix epigloea]|uniref:Uncharacterized protein n=1 Tax=Sporothrix epigloea TaxID=1892477 RepID=A0ABP0DVE2_9PEZI